MFQLAVFDIAGTTVHDPDGVGSCLRAALEVAGVSHDPAEVNARMGIPKPVAIAEIMALAGVTPDADRVGPIHADFQHRMKRYYQESPEVRPIEGVEDAIQRLRSMGVRVYLDTGFDRSIIDVILDRLGWASGLIDGTVGSDEVERGRPFPDMIFRAMELAGVSDAAKVIKAGDTPSDIEQGKAAGCGWTIGVLSGTHEAAPLWAQGPTHVLGSVVEIPSLVQAEASLRASTTE